MSIEDFTDVLKGGIRGLFVNTPRRPGHDKLMVHNESWRVVAINHKLIELFNECVEGGAMHNIQGSSGVYRSEYEYIEITNWTKFDDFLEKANIKVTIIDVATITICCVTSWPK